MKNRSLDSRFEAADPQVEPSSDFPRGSGIRSGPLGEVPPVSDAPTPAAELPAIAEVGAILDGKFRIDGLLGTGGMAMVLAATHLQLEQRVAIKLLLPTAVENPDVVARFLLEGRCASRIRSEHVVRVLDVGMDGDRPYLVMEYLDGMDLNALLVEKGPLPTTLAVDYLLQACEAIAEAHAGGMIHRDLKPANLFLTHRADGASCVKVLDFGISKLLQPHSSVVIGHETSPLLIMGTPHYMSPEQMQSAKSVDQRSDLWSLGAIFHELVVGKPPFQGESITSLCAAILMAPPPALSSELGDVPPALGAVVRRCLEKRPAERFANVAELASALAPFGSPAALASATCIERVLQGTDDTNRSEPPKALSVPQGPTAAETLASGPRHLTRRVLPYVVVIGLPFAALIGICWAMTQSHRWHLLPDVVHRDAIVAPSTPSVVLSAAGPPSALGATTASHAAGHPAATTKTRSSAAPSSSAPAAPGSGENPY
jgi:eukaryotic-like serine/threonine-protein kinase